MPEIEIGPDQIRIDAEIVAKALRLTPQDLQHRLREGTVTSRFEQGEGTDAGRLRLTFYSDIRRARIIADTSGVVLSCTAADFGRQPASAPAEHDRLDALLDAALEATFPASDPIAVSFDAPHRLQRAGGKG